MSKKLDPRVIRTRKLLSDSLMSLIVERDYENITIRDITDHATLNHATFYLHYGNKSELLNDTLDTMFEEVAKAVPALAEDRLDDVNIPMHISIQLFRHFGENANFYRVILGSEGITGFNTRLREYLAKTIYHRFSSLRANKAQAESLQFAAEYIASAYVGIIVWWLDNNQHLSPETLAQQFIAVTLGGVYQFIGIPIPEMNQYME